MLLNDGSIIDISMLDTPPVEQKQNSKRYHLLNSPSISSESENSEKIHYEFDQVWQSV